MCVINCLFVCATDDEDCNLEFDSLNVERIIGAIDYDIDPSRIDLLLQKKQIEAKYDFKNVLYSIQSNEWTKYNQYSDNEMRKAIKQMLLNQKSNDYKRKKEKHYNCIIDLIQDELKEKWKKYQRYSLPYLIEDIKQAWKVEFKS